MRSSTIAARCAALNTSIAQVIPDIASFARRLRDARSDLNTINNDLLIIRTGLGVAQDDFSTFGSTLPASLVEAFSQILDSSDDTSERLHKCFLKLSCGSCPKTDWLTLKNGPLVNLRQDLEASRIVLDLAVDYLSLFGHTDTLDMIIDNYIGDMAASTDELLKRTDMEEINVNQIARDRLSSLLQAIRQLRACITAISKDGAGAALKPQRRTTTPRPDSLEPALGETRRSTSNASQPSQISTTDKSIGAWLADVPCHQDAQSLTHSMIIKVTGEKQLPRPPSEYEHEGLSHHGTFYTDDGVSTSRTLVAPVESRLKKARSWCSEASTRLDVRMKAVRKSKHTQYTGTMSSSDISIFHRNITSDKLAVAKGRRKDLDIDSRVGVDRILANIPSDVTAIEVERVLWEGANPMVAHPEFGYFYIRAAYEMHPEVLGVLIEYGADITRTIPAPNKYYSAMHAATMGKRLRTVKYLASLGHSIDCANTLGETPLHLAARTPGASDVAKYLADTGADINHEANDGNTPLQRALTSTKLEGRERSEMIELLLSYGAEGGVNQDMEGRRSNSKGLSILGIS